MKPHQIFSFSIWNMGVPSACSWAVMGMEQAQNPPCNESVGLISEGPCAFCYLEKRQGPVFGARGRKPSRSIEWGESVFS